MGSAQLGKRCDLATLAHVGLRELGRANNPFAQGSDGGNGGRGRGAASARKCEGTFYNFSSQNPKLATSAPYLSF